MKLSKQLSDIALADYWHEQPLKQALACDLLDSDDKDVINLALNGIIDFHSLQQVSVKLFNLGA
jgi:hypothetical protein